MGILFNFQRNNKASDKFKQYDYQCNDEQSKKNN